VNPIYSPRGAAAEYARFALNLYRGCEHRCTYCYVPSCLRMSREDFGAACAPRPNILAELEKQLAKWTPDAGVLLSFTSDPYQPAEERYRLASRALALLADHGVPALVLTKAPNRALGLDRELLQRVELGTTLTGIGDTAAATWEPRAELPSERERAILRAAGEGISTWISVEPVLDPAGALAALRRLSGRVGVVKVGRWNHDARANRIDWSSFLADAVAILEAGGQKYVIKDALKKYAMPRGDERFSEKVLDMPSSRE
jgi:DNA repair photolyase